MEYDMHAPDAQGFIPGVFNYCDRRCERCRFVRQCRVGAVDVDDVGGGEAADEGVEDIKERLMKLMGLDPGDLEGWEDDDDGPDPEAFDLQPDPEMERRREQVDSATQEHPLTTLSEEYMRIFGKWIEERKTMLKDQGISLHKGMDLEIAPGLRTAEVLILSEAFDELLWFHTMLHVKCRRAVSGRIDDREWMQDLEMDPLQSDWNGTAKLAIEITRRSLDAWELVAAHMPELAADVAPMQELLHRILKVLEREFPDAEAFIRAGFDAPRQPRQGW
jgi:hypothetical protein